MSRKSFIIILCVCAVVAVVSIGSIVATNTIYVTDETFQEALNEFAVNYDNIDIVSFEAFWSVQAGHPVEVYYDKTGTLLLARYRNVTYVSPLSQDGSGP